MREPWLAPSRWGRRLLALVVLAAGAAGVPHLAARRIPAPSGAAADAILVLTGGENRIRTAYGAWREGKGRNLHILGVFRESTLERILPESAALAPDALARIHVEGWSENTLENAISAKSVVKARGYRTVVLVTSDYHMARAHLVVRSTLPPDVALTALAVPSDRAAKGAWLRLGRRYLVEGLKYWAYRLALLWE